MAPKFCAVSKFCDLHDTRGSRSNLLVSSGLRSAPVNIVCSLRDLDGRHEGGTAKSKPASSTIAPVPAWQFCSEALDVQEEEPIRKLPELQLAEWCLTDPFVGNC